LKGQQFICPVAKWFRCVTAGPAAEMRPSNPPRSKTILQVFVRDNNIDQALRALKRKMQREGVFREMKRRRFYEKPSDKATRERAESERRRRKRARKQAVLDGLIAAPQKKRIGLGGTGPGARPASSPAAPSRINRPR
jgi:small subunit ribosomal protein S21